ncbi:hypothetical protein CPAST_c22500 [Clostridium pasteurianum DSM 525 = ATCC 6013]|uniref:L-2-amino-thiazoline-4-carboxylic acid hydrolase n=1 Tax=Clostridium pasteurianum DSM 525 = ATCC 6013 TaxID=1262449 RepID=A0A0H3JA77_CLOPA|nr:L-2-amino-thiazoline-4-carboxylic acid hydrolase [Clostridium pasteurianum]AJA48320.1 hypothetical protein CPAST_c22500 [Clostridium pasteurianum DSM 525 = ATCC 6013]AJA52308.1 hypothetical protein CLPA_c22500 [Clostridium pasteurianum DSM 525 = ATCC 6013]AOZ75571.1 hypothetical protein AQ983_10925 [Clostridium pasteurianum DSM 525 = ATCC 6013]AOZ79366.1 hypothetical protein AQ984_10915 [Clostridium pasteurianum]ELP60530.1 hypothetical protein F502_03557 [Clostridium pasteurianum DSM 525 = 
MGKKDNIHCSIEHHAVLFAIFAKYTIEQFKEKGEEIIYNCVENYGRERGKRMAERTIANGDSLDFINSQAYGEWAAEKGQMEFGIVNLEPEYITNVTRCEWCENWKKYNLLDHGKYYCVNIDSAVFNGYNENFHMKATSDLSFGADCCEFHWGNAMTEEDIKKLTKKKEELGSSFTRNFDFHTAHLLYSISKTLKNELGEEGQLITDKVLDKYTELFGKDYLSVLYGQYDDKWNRP